MKGLLNRYHWWRALRGGCWYHLRRKGWVRFPKSYDANDFIEAEEYRPIPDPTFEERSGTYFYPGLCEEEIVREELMLRATQEADLQRRSIYRDPPDLTMAQRQMTLANLATAQQRSLIAHYKQMRRGCFCADSATSAILSAVTPLVSSLFPKRR